MRGTLGIGRSAARRGRKRILLVAPLLAGLALTACGSDDDSSTATQAPRATPAPGGSGAVPTTGGQPKKPFQVRIVSSLTGPSAARGLPASAGFETVLKLVNDQGGVNGHRIEYKVIDDRGDATVAPGAAVDALSGDPVAILDGSDSSFIVSRLPAYETAKVPVLSGGVTNKPLAPWFFTNFPSVPQNVGSMVDGAKALVGGSLTGKQVAVISADSPGGRALADAVKPLVEAQGGKLVRTEIVPLVDTSFTSGAANIVSSGAEVVIAFTGSASMVVEAKDLLSAGFKGPILGSLPAADDVTIQAIASPQYHGMRFTKLASPGTAMYAAAEKYGHKEATTGTYFGNGWALAQTLVAGLKACGDDCTPQSLIKAFDGLGTFTLPGDVIFGDYKLSPTLRNMIQSVQMYGWDPATKQVKETPNGLIKLGDPALPKA